VHTVKPPAPLPARITPEQRGRFERQLAELLAALGLPLDSPGTEGTPARLLDAWIDATSGYEPDPKLVTLFPAERREGAGGGHDQIVEGPIAFTALCEHHALPFLGNVWVGYVASGQLIGLSKLTRLVRCHSRRFTMQERLGADIAATLATIVRARGSAVYIEATHLCTRMRGVRETDAATRTATWRGAYEDDARLRREFMGLCGRG